MPNLLLIILYLLLPLGQLEQLPLGIPGARIYVHDLVLIIIWILVSTAGGHILYFF